ncbi:MAG: Hpt domain-containing protein [Thioalkalispiraceae bacterium]|jgi:HPt (histidine-containing phosphotransfer) domain-containing protein
MNNNQSCLEVSVIENLASFLSSENLQQLLTTYLRDSQKILADLDTVLTAKDARETTRLVHSLKSTSANIGAIRFSEMAKALEVLARAEKLDEVKAQLTELNALFAQTHDCIEKLDVMQN